MARVGLEELRLKKMVASDESLELLSSSFASSPSLVLVCFSPQLARTGEEKSSVRTSSSPDLARLQRWSSILQDKLTDQSSTQAWLHKIVYRSKRIPTRLTLRSTHRLLTLHHHHVFKSSVQPEMLSSKHDLGRGCNGRDDVVRRSICNTRIHHSSSVSL
ncbi:hypothetical protein YC2023_117446 [Brassica napus]